MNVHAPTEISNAHTKSRFYEELAKTYEDFPNNTIKIVMGGMNANCDKVIQYILTRGKESLHDHSEDSGLRIINFTTSNGMVISSTTFSHRDIYKAPWISPDDKKRNQIDHVLIQFRYRSSIFDIRSYRRVDCDTDHFLVIAKSQKKVKLQKKTKINIEILKELE